MNTNKRLTQAYKKAKMISFDSNSKFIFFSDIHRGDDSVSDEFSKNQLILLHALDTYYHKGYTYVEAGDGDELWEYKDFQYIRRAHGDIFTILKKYYKENRFYLLYGNHNMYLKNKKYVKENYYYYYDEYLQEYCDLFPGITPYESLVLKEKNTNQEILVVHGHQGDWANDQFGYLSMIFLRYFWRYLHVVGFRNPASPAKNQLKRHKIEKNYNKWIYHNQRILICGHTHRPKFPQKGELPYFNTGCCIHTKGIVGIELSGGKLRMVNWRMAADKNGVMKIKRTPIQKPIPISRYY